MSLLRYDYAGHRDISEGADWIGINRGLRPHFHEQIQVSVSLCGCRQYLIGGRRVTLRSAQLLIIPSYTVHRALPTESGQVRSTEFYLLPSKLAASVTTYLDGQDHQIVDAPWLIEVPSTDLPERMIVEVEKVVFRTPGCRNLTRNSQEVPHLIEALSFSGRLSDIAERLGFTPEGYIRSFSRRVGITPNAYRINMRLNSARRLLREGLSLVDVADAAGFSDQSHFGRLFLAWFGTTPGRFRSTHRRNYA
jgi:AraC-like DNA-binding protein